MVDAQITQVRRFNRMVTQRSGALEDHFLGRGRPLGASRVLYEIGAKGADVRALRARLGLDSGYLSRVIQSLEGERLIKVGPAPGDERVTRAQLTRAGTAEVREMNRRSDRAAESVLTPLSKPQRERLVAAMSEVCRLLQVAGAHIERVDPAAVEARWCVSQYFAELAERFQNGFDPHASIPAEDAELRPPRGSFLIATVDGDPVACGALKPISRRVGYLKRMWVAPSVRGLGFGRRMLVALEAEARHLGFKTLKLETNRALTEAIKLYENSGYKEVEPFNDEPYAHHWFEKKL
jgi:DNA-binding MarR family transcriptional regulator/N-acetylglutamate synthase-like GNAT family acetyltransferase